MESEQTTTFKLRLTHDLKEKISKSAEQFNRSMNADVVARLEKSFDEEQPYVQQVSVEYMSHAINNALADAIPRVIQDIYKSFVAAGVPPETINKAALKFMESEEDK